jgi:hypothetical protein
MRTFVVARWGQNDDIGGIKRTGYWRLLGWDADIGEGKGKIGGGIGGLRRIVVGKA